jgi:hypothetical protein
MRNLLVLIFLSLFLTACVESKFDKAQSEVIKQLEWLNDANPQVDFVKAIQKSDFRFFGVYGRSMFVPGINIKCLNQDKDIRFIEGTSDAYQGYEHEKLNAIAWVYADNYNIRMLRYLQERDEFKCAL